MVLRSRYRPHPTDRHRQRLLLPRSRLRPRPARRAPSTDHALHPAPQRKGGAIPPHPGRGIPLRTDLDLRDPTQRSPQSLEHPLQLPSTTLCRRRPATSITTRHWRHERGALLHLAGGRASNREQTVEEFSIAFKSDAEIFGRRLFAATPLLFETRTRLCEAAYELPDDIRDQPIRFLHAISGVVDETGLDI